MKNFRVSPYSFHPSSGHVIPFPLHRAPAPQDAYTYVPSLPHVVRRTAPAYPTLPALHTLAYPLRALLGVPARALTGSGFGLFRLLALAIAALVIFNPSVIDNSPYRGLILGGALGGASLAVLSSVSRCFGNVLNCLFWVGIAMVVGREWQGSSGPHSAASSSAVMQPVLANPQDWVDLSGRPLQMLKDLERSAITRPSPQQQKVAASRAANEPSFGSQPVLGSFFESASTSVKSALPSFRGGRSGRGQSPDIQISGSVIPDDAYFAPAQIAEGGPIGGSVAGPPSPIDSLMARLPSGVAKLLK